MVMLTCAVMYAMAAAHYFISFHGLVLTNNMSNKISGLLFGCMKAADRFFAGPDQQPLYDCVAGVAYNQTSLYLASDCTLSALLLVNVSLFSRRSCKKFL